MLETSNSSIDVFSGRLRWATLSICGRGRASNGLTVLRHVAEAWSRRSRREAWFEACDWKRHAHQRQSGRPRAKKGAPPCEHRLVSRL